MSCKLRRIVAYLDSIPLSRDLRQTRLASLREPHKGVILQSATGATKGVLRKGVAPKADVDIVPERSEWDAVRAG